METRANHVIVGAFASLVLLAAVAFVIWLGRFQIAAETSLYDIYFDGSITGLSPAGDVRYNGIKIGEVVDMALKENEPSKVRVRIEVEADAPVTADTVATLEFLGVTGVSYVLLSGGNEASKPIAKKAGDAYPVIASRTSGLQDIFSGAPQLITKANDIAAKLNLLLDDDNRQSVKAILDNAERFTGLLATSGEDFSGLVANLNQAAENINVLSADLRALTSHADTLVDQDIRALIAQTSRTAETAARVAVELEVLVRENRETITDFTRNGLGEVSRLASESRQLVRTIERVANRLDSDPSSLVYGASAPEVELK